MLMSRSWNVRRPMNVIILGLCAWEYSRKMYNTYGAMIYVIKGKMHISLTLQYNLDK